MKELCRPVVIATRLFVIASANTVMKVTASVISIDITDETFLSATAGAGSLLLTTSRQLRLFKLKSMICIHNKWIKTVVCKRIPVIRDCTIYICAIPESLSSLRISEGNYNIR